MTLYGIDLMDITFNISSNYLLLLNSLRLFCIILVLMLLFLGLVFDEKIAIIGLHFYGFYLF